MNKNLLKVYKSFLHKEGNQYIASEYAVQKIYKIIKTFDITHVLEVGLGIGSISGSILAVNNNIQYSGTESNPFCKKALERNLGTKINYLTVFDDITSIAGIKPIEFLIIDGADNSLRGVKELLNQHAIIVIEGDRTPQLKVLRELFPYHKYVHSISLKKNSGSGPFKEGTWQGGLKIIFIDPTWKQKIWWAREKLLTKLKYQYPGRYFGSTTD